MNRYKIWLENKKNEYRKKGYSENAISQLQNTFKREYQRSHKIDSTIRLSEVLVTAKQPYIGDKLALALTDKECKDFSCVKGVRKILNQLSEGRLDSKEAFGIRGNAWELSNNFKGKTLDFNPNNLSYGDVISFNRNSLASDKEKGIPNENQHTGVYIGKNEKGIPMVAHYSGGNSLRIDPLDKVKMANSNLYYTPNKILATDFNTRNTYSRHNYLPQVVNTPSKNATAKKIYEGISDLDLKKLGLSPEETKKVYDTTIGIAGLESDLGKSASYFLRDYLIPDFLQESYNAFHKKRDNIEASKGMFSLKPNTLFQEASKEESYIDDKGELAYKSVPINKQESTYFTPSTIIGGLINYGRYPSLRNSFSFLNNARPYRYIESVSPLSNRLRYLGVDPKRAGLGDTRFDASVVGAMVANRLSNNNQRSIYDLIALHQGNKKLSKYKRHKVDNILKTYNQPNVASSLREFLFDKKEDLKEYLYDNLLPKSSYFIPQGQAALRGLFLNRGKMPEINNSFYSKEHLKLFEDVANKAYKEGSSRLSYSDAPNTTKWTKNFTEEEASATGGKLLDMLFNPSLQLQNIYGQTPIYFNGSTARIIDTYDFNQSYNSPSSSFLSLLNSVNAKNPLLSKGLLYSLPRQIGASSTGLDGFGPKLNIKVPIKNVK